MNSEAAQLIKGDSTNKGNNKSGQLRRRGRRMEKNNHRTFRQRMENAEYAKPISLASTKLNFNSGKEIRNNEKENNNNSGAENNNNSGAENNNNSGAAFRNRRGRTRNKNKRISANEKRLQEEANYDDPKRLHRPHEVESTTFYPEYASLLRAIGRGRRMTKEQRMTAKEKRNGEAANYKDAKRLERPSKE